MTIAAAFVNSLKLVQFSISEYFSMKRVNIDLNCSYLGGSNYWGQVTGEFLIFTTGNYLGPFFGARAKNKPEIVSLKCDSVSGL